MFESISPRYDTANSVLSFGIHHVWRRALLQRLSVAPNGSSLDLCTGTGDLLKPLSARAGNVVGADFCLPMLEMARAKRRDQPENVNLLQGDALRLPFRDESFDRVTVAFGVRNFEDLEQGLREIHRVLRSGGQFLVLEFGQPVNLVWRKLYEFYSAHIMPVIGGLVTGNREAYRYLPKTAGDFPCREQFCTILFNCGFPKSEFRALTGGIAYLYDAKKL